MILRVTDLKQYAYCPRAVFFSYLMPVEKKTTFKMEEGRSAESEETPLEKRRTLNRYELPPGKRTFGLWLSSGSVGLSGKLDLLIEAESRYYPVDFKNSTTGLHPNMTLQLAGYALLVEARFETEVGLGFISFLPEGNVELVNLTPAVKNGARQTIALIQDMIRRERTPEPTERRRRCVECEYRNFCGDVW